MNPSDREQRPPASPPCFAHELTPEPCSAAELIAQLNELLEGERAGAQALTDMARDPAAAEHAVLLREVASDEGACCRMLRRNILRLHGDPSEATGRFYPKLLATEGLTARLQLLDRGQSVVVRVIDELLPRIVDSELIRDLREMRELHVCNIERVAGLIPPAGGA